MLAGGEGMRVQGCAKEYRVQQESADGITVATVQPAPTDAPHMPVNALVADIAALLVADFLAHRAMLQE